MGTLDGRVAVVTGAGSGVGRATAQTLAAEGAAVVLVGRTEERLRETAAQIDARADTSERVLVAPCDVTDRARVERMVGKAQARFGRVDILFNNAGYNVSRRTLAELQDEEWRRIVAINLDGAYLCTQAVLPIMRAQGGGTLVHTGSIAAARPSPLAGSAYTAAKAGLAALSGAINAEERRNGIRSAVIVLGETDTPLLDRRPSPPDAATRARALQPEDVAACVLLIAALPQRATVEEIVLMPTQ